MCETERRTEDGCKLCIRGAKSNGNYEKLPEDRRRRRLRTSTSCSSLPHGVFPPGKFSDDDGLIRRTRINQNDIEVTAAVYTKP